MNTPRPADNKFRQGRKRRRRDGDIEIGLRVYREEKGEEQKPNQK